MITFKYIRELYENEKKHTQLQKLEEDFIDKIKEYFKRKEKIIKKTSLSVFDYSVLQEVENFKALLMSLFELRKKKILIKALNDIKTSISPEEDVFLEFERRLYDKVKDLLMEYENNLISMLSLPSMEEDILNVKKEKDEEKVPLESQKCVVEALDNIPSFLSPNKEFVGPYIKGEKFICDRNTAMLLLRLKKVKIIDSVPAQDKKLE